MLRVNKKLNKINKKVKLNVPNRKIIKNNLKNSIFVCVHNICSLQ